MKTVYGNSAGMLTNQFSVRFFALASLFACAACGFSPLYGARSNGKSVEPQMAEVHVMIIQDAAGQALRNNILDRMPPEGPQPRYELKVLVAETSIGVSIAPDATVTRQQLRNNLHAELIETATQKAVWKTDMAATAGYNVLSSQFSNLIGEEDARRRNLDDLAERLVNQVALYFNRPAS